MAIDIISAFIISYAFYRGFTNGLIGTVVDTLSIVIGAVIALKFSPALTPHLQQVVNVGAFAPWISLILVFFVVLFILRFIGKQMEGVLKSANLNIINQLAGGALLGFVVAFLMGGLIVFLSNQNILTADYTEKSTLYSHLVAVNRDGGWVIDGLKDLFTEFWSQFSSAVDSVDKKI